MMPHQELFADNWQSIRIFAHQKLLIHNEEERKTKSTRNQQLAEG